MFVQAGSSPAMVSVQLRLRKMRADSASHLLRHPINFELFLFLYLVCALLLQKINIYKKVGGGRYLEINFFVCACVSLCSKYHVTLFKKCIYSCIYSCHTSRTTYTSHTQHASHSTHHTQHTPHTQTEFPSDRLQSCDFYRCDSQSASGMVHSTRAASTLESKKF